MTIFTSRMAVKFIEGEYVDILDPREELYNPGIYMYNIYLSIYIARHTYE
jgi:hypothetical protein